jgi:predicted sugar kinase
LFTTCELPAGNSEIKIIALQLQRTKSRDVLCRYIEVDFRDAAGIDSLLMLGASPHALRKDEFGESVNALQLALERMLKSNTFQGDVLRCL